MHITKHDFSCYIVLCVKSLQWMRLCCQAHRAHWRPPPRGDGIQFFLFCLRRQICARCINCSSNMLPLAACPFVCDATSQTPWFPFSSSSSHVCINIYVVLCIDNLWLMWGIWGTFPGGLWFVKGTLPAGVCAHGRFFGFCYKLEPWGDPINPALRGTDHLLSLAPYSCCSLQW